MRGVASDDETVLHIESAEKGVVVVEEFDRGVRAVGRALGMKCVDYCGADCAGVVPDGIVEFRNVARVQIDMWHEQSTCRRI